MKSIRGKKSDPKKKTFEFVKFENEVLTTKRDGGLRWEDFILSGNVVAACKHYGDHEHTSWSETEVFVGDKSPLQVLIEAAIDFHIDGDYRLWDGGTQPAASQITEGGVLN